MGRNMYIDTAEYEGVYQIRGGSPSGKTIPLDVTGTDTIEVVKATIQNKARWYSTLDGILHDQYRVVLEGEQLEDARTPCRTAESSITRNCPLCCG